MKVAEISIKNFKRFSNLKITGISQSTKLVVIAGPNGSGKSSLFDAFNHYYRINSGFGYSSDESYFRKSQTESFDWYQNVDIRFHGSSGRQIEKKSMYFRTAYRNDPDFNIGSLSRIEAPHQNIRINRLIDNDQAVAENYQRLVHNTMSGVFLEINDEKSVRQLREELIGKIRSSMLNVFDDLVLNNIGDPLSDGAFYFKKGLVDSYHYKNLSGGEKAAFDLLLDLILKVEHYDDSIFFIDEPETHMHTSLQGKLIEEMFRVIPENSQMWVTSHSLGVMRKAKELSLEDPNSVAFIDFGEIDFDEETTLIPASIDGLMWEKFLSIALDGYETRFSPEILVMCEGNINGIKRKNFDAFLYEKVFSGKYPNISFVSGGSCNDLENPEHIGFKLLSQVLKDSKLVRLIDRDDKSDAEVEELIEENIFVTGRRNIESYLLDDELIEKLVLQCQREDLLSQALLIKSEALEDSVKRGNPSDDLKRASGDIFIGLKRLLNLTRCGNNADTFMRDTMASLITVDTIIYKEMERSIIIPILK
ncbi:AAA family ATPase, partial [Vibrio cholerae]